MPLVPGVPVVLKSTRISRAGGQRTAFDEGLKGRVCRISESGSGICWVQFPGRCLRVHEDFLAESTEPAPFCEGDCSGFG